MPDWRSGVSDRTGSTDRFAGVESEGWLFRDRPTNARILSAMTKDQIIAVIKTRMGALRDSCTIGDSSDPLIFTAAQVSWEKAEEYESLLAEIDKSQ